MNRNHNVTLVIQGPMHPNAIIMMKMHAHAFDIVFSTWKVNPEEENKIEEHLREVECTKLVFNNIDSLEFMNNQSNRYYQFYTTLKGMQLVDTEYAIKIRSDEYYTDLSPFVEKMLENPEKIVTNEVFFRDPRSSTNENFMLHPSDHLYGGKTEDLVNMLRKSVDDCKNHTVEDLDRMLGSIKNRSYVIVPEQHLFANYLITRHGVNLSGEKLTVAKAMKLTKKNCEIVKSSDLGFYCISFFKSFNFYPTAAYFKAESDIENIEDFEDIEEATAAPNDTKETKSVIQEEPTLFGVIDENPEPEIQQDVIMPHSMGPAVRPTQLQRRFRNNGRT